MRWNYYKLRKLSLLQSAMDRYYKLRQLFYYKVRHGLLQITTGITNCDGFITNCDRYYKVRWLLQIATVQPYRLSVYSLLAKKSTWSWACDLVKTRNLSEGSLKNTRNLARSTPDPAIRSSDSSQRLPSFDSCQMITMWMYNIRLQAPTLTFHIGFPVVRTEGRKDGRRVGRTVTWLPKFLEWIVNQSSLIIYGASWARGAAQ